MLSVLALGIVIASTLLAAAPIYARTMGDLGLTFVVREDLESTSATRILLRDAEIGTSDGQALSDAIDARIDERAGWFTGSIARYELGARFTIAGETEIEPVFGQPYLELQAFEGYEEHVSIDEGRLPARSAPGVPIEVAISAEGAEAADLALGDTVVLSERLDDCEQEIVEGEMPVVTPCPPGTPTVELLYQLQATVVAIVSPLDDESPAWPGGANAFFAPRRAIPGAGPQVPAFTHPETLTLDLGTALPGYRADLSWRLDVDPEAISRANYRRALADIEALRDDLLPLGALTFSPLVNTLAEFERGESVKQTPLTILLLQISAIALFYVGLVSAIVVERQSDEVALLRSRGASVAQVLTIYLGEGLLVAIPTLLVAPLLATIATSALGLTPAFKDVNDGNLLPAVLVPQAFLWALAGVTLSLLAVVVPVFFVARRTSVTQKRQEARPSPSILQRYYLDLALAAFAGVLLWELNERGSAFEPSSTGGISSDPILLASPTLIIAAAAALVLRFYPLILRVATRGLTAVAGVTVTIGLWQLVRRPGQYTRLTLLLMMGVAVGTFAASYSSTADRSYRDRAAFAAGTDLRARTADRITAPGNTQDHEADLAAIDGIDLASLVYRSGTRTGAVGNSGRQVVILGVDPTDASTMLFSREDFADQSLQSLMFQLQGADQLRGLPVPAGATSVTLWVNSTVSRGDVSLWLRVRDANGIHRLFSFGKLDTPGWRLMEAPLSTATVTLAEPATVLGILMTEPPSRFNTFPDPVYFDDLTAVGPGVSEVLDDFETIRWDNLPTLENASDEYELSSDEVQSGTLAGKFTFRLGVQNERRGLYALDENVPIRILASDEFTNLTGISAGGLGTLRHGQVLVPIRVVAGFEHFPTLPGDDGPAIVVNLDQFASWVNAFNPSGAPNVEPNEAWFKLSPTVDTEALEDTLSAPPWRMGRFVNHASELDTIQRNPLLTAGGAGILLVSFAGVLVLIGVAFLVSLWTAVERRRTEFAVLRAMGISRGQLLRLLTFEYALVSIVGVVVGAYLGLLVGRQMLSFLDVTEAGNRVEPSFILQTDWSMVAGGGGVVAAVFILALLFAVRIIARTTDAQALRND
ncbi:MAG: FtsX-like permease family protein [Dehalococcoidia bacterium]